MATSGNQLQVSLSLSLSLHVFYVLSTCFAREWVHELTSHDIANKNYTLEDVVLPVAGSSVILPGNKVKDK